MSSTAFFIDAAAKTVIDLSCAMADGEPAAATAATIAAIRALRRVDKVALLQKRAPTGAERRRGFRDDRGGRGGANPQRRSGPPSAGPRARGRGFRPCQALP